MAEDAYAKKLVKDYVHWGVYVHEDQGFIGRCVIWAKREDALDLALSTKEEQTELFEILPRLRAAAEKSFGATWFNYSFLGNVDRHMHGHFIPRYKEPVIFEGITFTDLNYNTNPSRTGTTNMVSKEVLEKIRALLSSKL
jgi:diadenosine tetraphosphate (Ap4A) HIT family hydrolase